MDAELEVVRCTDCQALITYDEIKQFGCCPECNCKRVRNVLTMKPEEEQKLREKGVSEAFFTLFEATDHA
jgi:uncharacterized CHY-type Zn-finger protein